MGITERHSTAQLIWPKTKWFEKAEDALKKKNENLYKAYKLGKDVKDDVFKGDYAAVWEKTKDAAYDEAKGFVEDKLIEKVIPGYGQLKGAWDTGYYHWRAYRPNTNFRRWPNSE